MALERRIIPFESQFLVINNRELINKLNLEKNTPYILRNGAVEAYERYSGDQVEDDEEEGFITYEMGGSLMKSVRFEKYQGDIKFLRTLKSNSLIDRNQKSIQRATEMRAYIDFVMPKIVFLRDLKFKYIG